MPDKPENPDAKNPNMTKLTLNVYGETGDVYVPKNPTEEDLEIVSKRIYDSLMAIAQAKKVLEE